MNKIDITLIEYGCNCSEVKLMFEIIIRDSNSSLSVAHDKLIIVTIVVLFF